MLRDPNRVVEKCVEVPAIIEVVVRGSMSETAEECSEVVLFSLVVMPEVLVGVVEEPSAVAVLSVAPASVEVSLVFAELVKVLAVVLEEAPVTGSAAPVVPEAVAEELKVATSDLGAVPVVFRPVVVVSTSLPLSWPFSREGDVSESPPELEIKAEAEFDDTCTSESL